MNNRFQRLKHKEQGKKSGKLGYKISEHANQFPGKEPRTMYQSIQSDISRPALLQRHAASETEFTSVFSRGEDIH